MPNEITADFVVVGSGAGGAPLAARLALAGFEVLVLEAGGDRGKSLNYQVPAFHARASEDPDMSWNFFVQHYEKHAERQSEDYDPKFNKDQGGIFYPRAAALGGCTAHHALITIYPHNSDWQALADLTKDDSWAPEKMRALFEERVERCGYRKRPVVPGFNPTRHGFDGWLGTQQADPRTAVGDQQLLTVILSAASETFLDKLTQEHGSPLEALRALLWNDPLELLSVLADGNDPREILKQLFLRHLDPNDWAITRGRGEGVFSVPLSTWQGHRRGPREFLLETRDKVGNKLRIETNALATRVLLDDAQTATGVEFLKGNHFYRADPNADKAPKPETWLAHARREVILAGGTFNTPQLLMLSGIGPPEHLESAAIKIECRVALPGVGRNLQDRYEVGVISEMKRPFGVLGDCGFKTPAAADPDDPCLEQWTKDGTGLYSTNGAVLAIIRRSRPELPDPRPVPLRPAGNLQGLLRSLLGGDRPRAGPLHLGDPQGPHQKHRRHSGAVLGGPACGASDQLPLFRQGHRPRRRRPPGRGRECEAGAADHEPPAAGRSGDEDRADPRREHRRRQGYRGPRHEVGLGHHACGTCKMGRKTDDGKLPPDDPNAVIDGDFRVYGTRNLRVVDASVFPRIPGFFIVTSVYLISERASKAILGAGG